METGKFERLPYPDRASARQALIADLAFGLNGFIVREYQVPKDESPSSYYDYTYTGGPMDGDTLLGFHEPNRVRIDGKDDWEVLADVNVRTSERLLQPGASGGEKRDLQRDCYLLLAWRYNPDTGQPEYRTLKPEEVGTVSRHILSPLQRKTRFSVEKVLRTTNTDELPPYLGDMPLDRLLREAGVDDPSVLQTVEGWTLRHLYNELCALHADACGFHHELAGVSPSSWESLEKPDALQRGSDPATCARAKGNVNCAAIFSASTPPPCGCCAPRSLLLRCFPSSRKAVPIAGHSASKAI